MSAPLRLVLFVLVIGAAAVLVAVTLLPIAMILRSASNQVEGRIQQINATFRRITFPQTSRIYAADGKTLLATVDSGENRTNVKLENVSEVTQEAVLAIEDDDFYEHGAVDSAAIMRALIANVAAGRVTQGGSTITQQLVKNAVIGSDATTVERKFQEAVLAARVEDYYQGDKDKILELYLNQIYLANGVYGIETASQFYFKKPASKLRLPEASLLAGMIRAPEEYDPIHDRKEALERRNDVLARMLELEWISEQQARNARKTKIDQLLRVERNTREETQPFIVSYATREMLDLDNHEFDKVLGTTEFQRRHSLGEGGFKITTTYDPKLQAYAQDAASRALPASNGPQAAIVTVENKTGAIRTMMSGQNYEKDEQNLAAAANVDGHWEGVRQPGSAFKPFTLVAAFENGISPSDTYSSSSPIHISKWDNQCHCVSNAEPFSSGGNIDLRAATAGSVNVVFAQLILDVGPEKVVKVAEDMGITTPMLDVPSLTLGSEETSPLDMASGFQTLANDGEHCDPFIVDRISAPGQPRYYTHNPKKHCDEVIKPDIARTVTEMLEGVVQGGTGTAAAIGRDVAGKTGTSQDSADLWFVGFVPQYTTAVWVGHPEGRVPMEGQYGGTVAAPIWHDYMLDVLRDVPIEGFEKAGKLESREKVEDVVGRLVEDAERILEHDGFRVSVNEVDSKELEGTVVEQSPGPGERADTGSTIRLDVSGAGATSRVPDVTGMIKYEARSVLDEAGFGVELSYEKVTQDDKNRIVLSQIPEAGEKLQEAETVTLVVGNKAKN
ncbi:MAG: transglycosylase domain-containing protein [Actinomycetota bacterium]